MATLESLFQQFLRERRYLKNVSPKTLVWYESALKAFLTSQPPGLGQIEVDGGSPLTRAHLAIGDARFLRVQSLQSATLMGGIAMDETKGTLAVMLRPLSRESCTARPVSWS